MELLGTSLHSWELINHTSVTIEPPGRGGFILIFERLGLDDRWLQPHGPGYCFVGYQPDLAPIGPDARHPVSHPFIDGDRTFPAGTWRAVVDYRDPRHPALASRAEATFDVVGLNVAQAEEVLAAVAAPSRRACVVFASFAYSFARTAPLPMLPRLLELSEESIAEREEALVAITDITHDETLLRRALRDENPSVRLAGARAVARRGTRDDLLWRLATTEFLARAMAEAPMEVVDVPPLFRLPWTQAVLPRLLRRVADRRARQVSAALAQSFGVYVDRFARAELVRIRQALMRTIAQVRDAEARSPYLRAIRDLTAALTAPGGSFHTTPESTPEDPELIGSMMPEGCEPVREALRTMTRLAASPEEMQFIPRGRR